MDFNSNYWKWRRSCYAFVEDISLMGQVHISAAFQMNDFLRISKHLVSCILIWCIEYTCDVREVTSADLLISQAFKITRCNVNPNNKSPARTRIQIYPASLRNKPLFDLMSGYPAMAGVESGLMGMNYIFYLSLVAQ